MANIACGNARLGHGHALSLPLEGHLDMPHPIGVGVLLPETITFNLPVLPDKVAPLAEAFEVDTVGLGRGEIIEACAQAVRDLYADIDFPSASPPRISPPAGCARWRSAPCPASTPASRATTSIT